MWVASWFSGIPSVGNKLLDTPKYLTHVLCHSRVCQSTLPRTRSALQTSSSLQPTLSTLQNTPRFQVASPALTSNSDEHSTQQSLRASQSSWIGAIEKLLLTSIPSNDRTHPLSELLGSIQSVFDQLPIVATSKETNPPVAIVEVGYDGTPLSQSESLLPRFGFWQCPTASNSSGGFQIWVKGCQVAMVGDRSSAQALAQQINRLLETPNLDASKLRAAFVNNQPGAKLDDRAIFAVSERLAARLGRPAELVAIEWVNNLRIALGQSSIPLADAQAEMYQLATTDNSIGGMASWYGPYFHGRQTANGEIFDQDELTAAHPTLPLGTFLKVTNRLNGKSVVVRVNDRGPYFDNRVLDLSRRAASIIDSDERGVVPIKAVVMQSATTTEVRKPSQKLARLVTGY